MLLSSLVPYLRTIPRGKVRRAAKAMKPRRAVLEVERLEDRTLLSTFLVDNTLDSGSGSLRQAILDANSTPNVGGLLDEIHFNIPGGGVHTIQPISALPTVTAPVIIDGYTQLGSSPNALLQGSNAVLMIELSGSSAGASKVALTISGGMSTVRGLAINRFSGGGIFLNSQGGNTIEGNFIGTAPSGTSAFAVGGYGVMASFGSPNNLIGGLTLAARNVISGNARGIVINSSSTANRVQGNLIGTTAAGTGALGNTGYGLEVGTANNLIGGADPGAGNVISANNAGVNISGVGNQVKGNLIGTDVTGTVALGNVAEGITAGSFVTIGGAEPGARNVISGNRTYGVTLSAGSNNIVQGNYIGTDITGTAALGNRSAGIFVEGGDNNLIGGNVAGAGNVVSGNSSFGIFIQAFFSDDATGNQVQGNYVGTTTGGQVVLSNLGSGVVIAGSNNLIGGTATGAGNTIAFNQNAGVSVSAKSGNAICQNSIYANGGLGIDLAGGATGVTPNDPGDSDTGANDLQNYPVLTLAASSSSGTAVSGTLNSRPATAFTIEFFSSPSSDVSGYGEGRTFLGSSVVSTDAAGNASFAGAFAAQVPIGHVLTATATNFANSTSEFSQARTVVPDVDDDLDGNGDAVEDGAPNGGDGNSDGMLDSAQANVASLLNAQGTGYVTVASPAGTVLVDVASSGNPSPGDTPAGAEFPFGFLEFAVQNVAPGSARTVEVFLNASTTVNTYYKYGPTPGNPAPHWYNFAFDGTTGAEVAGNRIILHFVDGARGDDDLTVNGTIVDPGAPTFLLNQPPATQDDLYSVTEDNSLTVIVPGILDNDTDADGDPLTAVFVSGPAHGTLQLNANGSFTYAPAPNFDGTDSFTYKANDGTADSSPATVTITVNAVNDAPTASISLSDHVPKTNAILTATATASDVEGDPITLTYTWRVNGIAKQTHITTSLSDSFDMGVAGQGDRGDSITVEMTPYDGTVNGSTVVDSATVLVGFVVTNTNDNGPGSLREAILDSNATAGSDIIRFNIPGAGPHSIAPMSGLPGLTDPVTVDGWSQPGFAGAPLIELNGANAGWTNGGLSITAADTTVRGLVINRFVFAGIFVAGSDAAGTKIQGNYLGTDVSGTANLGNLFGVYLVSTDHVLIGADADGVEDALERNVIFSPDVGGGGGIRCDQSTDITIQGNYVGTDVSGNFAIANLYFGIEVDNSSGVKIGGAEPGAGNLIAGGGIGVLLEANAHDVVIQGNRIGTNAAGTAALGNSIGIYAGATVRDVLVGGTRPGEGNLISGTGFSGILADPGSSRLTIQGNRIGTDVSGSLALPNVYGMLLYGGDHLVGGTAPGAGNLISGNSNHGIQIAENVSLIRVEGNTIGLNLAGTGALANSTGIYVRAARDVVLGGSDPAARNLISGNSGVGLVVANSTTAGNVVRGNWIGTDPSGFSAIPNGTGVALYGSQGDAVIDNLISGNGSGGGVFVWTCGSSVIQGNTIGATVNGTAALPNQAYGILLGSSHDVSIGGAGAGRGNLISGNLLYGIGMPEADIHHITVQGNRIGTNAAGTASIGNGTYGVFIYQAHDNLIGGSGPGEGNLISGNGGPGVGIGIATAAGNVVQGNTIGADAAGMLNLGNGGSGVYIFHGASGNFIGGVAAGERNLIAFNGGAGVFADSGDGNAIRGNAIFSNGGLGIDLGMNLMTGATPNDLGDADTGPNNLQNFPIISVIEAGATTHVIGSINGTPNTSLTLDFYASQSTDPSGFGEGQRYLGMIAVTTDSNGDAAFDAFLPAAADVGEFLAGTATDASGNTSEFSGAPSVLPFNHTPIGVADFLVTDEDKPVSGNVLGNDADPDGDAVRVNGYYSAAHGAVAIWSNGDFIYTPNLDFNGTDSFIYELGDGHFFPNPLYWAARDYVTVTITVNSVNDAPYALNFSVETDEDSPVSGRLSATDIDGDSLTYSLVNGPLYGTAILQADGSFLYTPNANFNGTDRLSYTANDGAADSSPATVTITVDPVNDAPVAIPGGPYSVSEGASVVLDGSASYDADLPAIALSYQWDLDGDGIFSETGAAAGRGNEVGAKPTFSAAGLDGPAARTAVLRVVDTSGLATSATFEIAVANVAPIATLSNSGPAVYGTAVTVNFANPFDPSPIDTAEGFRYSYSSDGITFSNPGSQSSWSLNLNAGFHTIYGRIYNKDGDYSEYSTTVTVDKANAVIVVNGYSGVYDGHAHGLTGAATGVRGENLSGLLNFGASQTNANIYAIDWIFAGDNDYNAATGTRTIDIHKATPSVQVTGGSFIYDGIAHPATGSVTGVNGANLGNPALTYSYTDGQGNVVTSASPPVAPGYYTVTATFGGDANYQASSATATITIAFEVRNLTDLNKAFNAGRTIPIKLQLTDAAGHNVSSGGINLTALQLERINADGSRTRMALQDAGSSNPANLFRYDAALNGYIFNLSTKGLTAGNYEFFWTADGDPTQHLLRFVLR